MGIGNQTEDHKPPPQHGQQQPESPELRTGSTNNLYGGLSSNFVRTNPRSDRFTVNRFHHVEYWCADATNCSRRFSHGLGMPIVAKSDISTGNLTHTSYLLRSGDLSFLFTAPRYSPDSSSTGPSIPTFSSTAFSSFYSKHGGIAVRAIAVEVEDASHAYSSSISAGGITISPPILLPGDTICPDTLIAEVQLYGDVVLRYVSYMNKNLNNNNNPMTADDLSIPVGSSSFSFLPNFTSVSAKKETNALDFGLRTLDHVLGIVPKMDPTTTYLKQFTGFHEFAEFTGDEIGTKESGLNVTVLANNNEKVMLAVSEPVHGTKRKGPAMNYLIHNGGSGVQHMAMGSNDILKTLRKMSSAGGFEFMPSPLLSYYKNLKRRVGDVLSDEKINECEEMGIMVDRDDQGVVLQIFTKSIGDRPTMFLEVIQRIGCMEKDDQGKLYQKGGCGGFGKGNVSELYRSIEENEKALKLELN